MIKIKYSFILPLLLSILLILFVPIGTSIISMEHSHFIALGGGGSDPGDDGPLPPVAGKGVFPNCNCPAWQNINCGCLW